MAKSDSVDEGRLQIAAFRWMERTGSSLGMGSDAEMPAFETMVLLMQQLAEALAFLRWDTPLPWLERAQ